MYDKHRHKTLRMTSEFRTRYPTIRTVKNKVPTLHLSATE